MRNSHDMTGTVIRKQLIAIALLAHLCFLRIHTRSETDVGHVEALLTADIPVRQPNLPSD